MVFAPTGQKSVVRQAQKKLLTQLVQYSVGIRDHLASPAVFSRFKELKGIFMDFIFCVFFYDFHTQSQLLEDVLPPEGTLQPHSKLFNMFYKRCFS